MKTLLRLVLIPMIFMVVSCEEIVNNTLSFDPESITVEAEQTSGTFNINSTASWILNVPSEVTWLTLDKTEGDAGTHRINISFETNTDSTARTVSITAVCAGIEKSLSITQLGQTDTTGSNKPDEPEVVYGKPIKKIIISDPSYGDFTTTYFEYNAYGKIESMKASYNSGGEQEMFNYIFKYDKSTITITSDNKEAYTAELDSKGRVIKLNYREDGDADCITVTYDNNGYLNQETKSNGDEISYFWSDSNLIKSHIIYYDEEFLYATEYKNNTNIDINWIVSASYGGSDLAPFGIIGALGKRSKNFVVPNYWAENQTPTPIWDVERPVCEDLINSTNDIEYTSYQSDYMSSEYQFDFDNNNDLTRIYVDIPTWKIKKRRTDKIVLVNPDLFEERDGKKYYWDIKIEEVKTVEIERSKIENITEVTLEY